PNAAVDLLKLQSGNLLLVYNDSMKDRTPLTAALSTDGGKTFPYRRNVGEGPGDFAYPYAAQTRDGKIHLVFTTDERTVIRRAVSDERWLVEAKPIGEKAPRRPPEGEKKGVQERHPAVGQAAGLPSAPTGRRPVPPTEASVLRHVKVYAEPG